MNRTEQSNFLESFGDLLQREIALISGFRQMSLENWGALPQEERIKLLDSLEDLLRRLSNLLKNYEDLYKMVNGGLTLEKYVDKKIVVSGETVTYRYVVKNWYNKTANNVTIIDDQLGIIVEGISLGPGELMTFTKSAVITGTTCNTAVACGVGPYGGMVCDRTSTVCVDILRPGKNTDILTIGNQESFTAGSDHPTAFNDVLIKKNQKATCSNSSPIYNVEDIKIGNQRSYGFFSGQSNNVIKIVANQE
jgi:hypothetical protein